MKSNKTMLKWSLCLIAFVWGCGMASPVRAHAPQPPGRITNLRQSVGWNAIPTYAGLPIRPTSTKISAQVWAATADAATADVLVLLAAQADLSGARSAPTKAARGRWVQSHLWEVAQQTQRPLQGWLTEQDVVYRSFYIVNMLQLEADRALLLTLAGRADVARILTNPQVRMDPGPQPWESQANASQPHAPQGIEWGVRKINAPDVWAQGFTGQGIVIAGQDTGYDWDHPALQAAYRGWDGDAATHDYHWHDAIHSDGGSCGPDSPEPCDDYGHGTHTMGALVGDDGGANQIGVAPGARWIGCRNMDQGWGSPATYAECFEFFMAPYPVGATPAEGDPGQAPDVINNSWSCPTYEGCDAEHIALLAQVVANVRAAGIMVVASAGNGGSGGCGTIDEPPGIYTATYTIGATNSSDSLASFSSRGPATWNGQTYAKPDIAAPGVSVRSSLSGGGYGLKSGTSMASPHVAGAVALLWSAHPALRANFDWTEQVLNATAQPIPTTTCSSEQSVPNHLYGWGRLDVGNAVTSVAAIEGVVQQMTSTLRASQAITYEIEAARTPLLTWATTTDAEGRYRMMVVSGAYTLTVSHAGEVLTTTPPVQVTAGQTTTVNITVPALCKPVTDTTISWHPPAPTFHSPVTFTGSVSEGSLPITYTWHFEDDDTVITGNPISHTFTGPPSSTHMLMLSYRVTLTATNPCGREVRTTIVPVATECTPISGTVMTWQPPTPSFGRPLTFAGAVTAGTLPITYTWQLGDAGAIIKTGNPITHTFAEPPASTNTLILPHRVTLTTTNLCSEESIRAWLPLYRTPQPRLYLPVVVRQRTG
jgi:subtilisin family serine protease